MSLVWPILAHLSAEPLVGLKHHTGGVGRARTTESRPDPEIRGVAERRRRRRNDLRPTRRRSDPPRGSDSRRRGATDSTVQKITP
jgi:hypothetical protein